MVLGLSREPQVLLAPKGDPAGSYGPAPSIHLGQGQRVQCEPLLEHRHSLRGVFSLAQTGDNSW